MYSFKLLLFSLVLAGYTLANPTTLKARQVIFKEVDLPEDHAIRAGNYLGFQVVNENVESCSDACTLKDFCVGADYYKLTSPCKNGTAEYEQWICAFYSDRKWIDPMYATDGAGQAQCSDQDLKTSISSSVGLILKD